MRTCLFAVATALLSVWTAAAAPAAGYLQLAFTSTMDGTEQPAWLYVPTNRPSGKMPLLVSLHSWSYGWQQKTPRDAFEGVCEKRGWAMVHPDFRGPNKTPKACGSAFAVQDVIDAIAAVKARLPIDESRIYAVGGSGGGHFALLLAARHPEVWAGVYAACPISDLARWHRESVAFGDWRRQYADMMTAACGGTPDEKPDEYRARSPLGDLARAKGVPVHICEGVHDGHNGSVPIGHSIRAFNALAAEKDRLDDAFIGFAEKNETVPADLAFKGRDPFFAAKNRIHFRRTSGNVCLTLFEGGHAGNYASAADFLARQTKGRPADWTIPATGAGGENVSTK